MYGCTFIYLGVHYCFYFYFFTVPTKYFRIAIPSFTGMGDIAISINGIF